MNNVGIAVKYLDRAYELGWRNWDPVMNSEEIAEVRSEVEIIEFLKRVE